MAKKPKLGTKRVCPNCGTKYYDLERDPIVCPSCGTTFVLPETKTRTKAPKEEPAKPAEPEAAEAEAESGPETVSLEEADEEALETGAVKVDLGEDADEDDEALKSDDDDDTFLAEDDDEDDDVDSVIGEVKKDED